MKPIVSPATRNNPKLSQEVEELTVIDKNSIESIYNLIFNESKKGGLGEDDK